LAAVKVEVASNGAKKGRRRIPNAAKLKNQRWGKKPEGASIEAVCRDLTAYVSPSLLFCNVDRIDIPKKAIYRLSIYSRCLQRLVENEQKTVSSSALAKAAGVKPSQLRKDLAYFGQFGTRGLGYPVETLASMIRDTLGRERLQPVILVGAGNLGSALLRYQGFKKEGFEVVAAFDADPSSVKVNGISVPVYSEKELEALIAKEQVRLAILCVPGNIAQSVANRLVDAGVQGILNFSSARLDVPAVVVVNNVDLALELEHLSFFVR
jgi:redox-sensing transcriptional repressor